MKKQVEDWILLADKDLYAAEIIINDDYPLTNIVAFHCQQTIEKYFKAFLIEKNIPLIKTHDLIKLNGMIKEIGDLGIDERKLIIINEVYLDSRYPGEFGLMADKGHKTSSKKTNSFNKHFNNLTHNKIDQQKTA